MDAVPSKTAATETMMGCEIAWSRRRPTETMRWSADIPVRLVRLPPKKRTRMSRMSALQPNLYGAREGAAELVCRNSRIRDVIDSKTASRLSMVTRFSKPLGLMNLADFDGLGDGKFISRAES